MSLRFFFACFILALHSFAQGQQLTRAEIFIDADPGFGNGRLITIPPAGNATDILVSIQIDTLGDGPHFLYLRSQDSNGWSITNSWLFLKQSPAPTVSNIVKSEYFIDVDPGFGSGNNIPAISTADATVSFNASLNSVGAGLHFLYLRSMSADGVWSITNSWPFYKQIPSTLSNVVKAECFIDIDPGFGNAKAINLNPASSNFTNLQLSINLDSLGLDTSLHRFYIRTMDEMGNWSITNRDTFRLQKLALPLKWESFTAVERSGNAYLIWKTADETNTSTFEVHHSTNLQDWKTLDTIAAKNQLKNEYAYQHILPTPGENYYRIRQVDKDNKFSWSTIRSVYYFIKSGKLKVIPNPVTGNRIKVSSDIFTRENSVVRVIGSDGITYQVNKIALQSSNTVIIDLNRFVSTGTFYLEVSSRSRREIVPLIVPAR